MYWTMHYGLDSQNKTIFASKWKEEFFFFIYQEQRRSLFLKEQKQLPFQDPK